MNNNEDFPFGNDKELRTWTIISRDMSMKLTKRPQAESLKPEGLLGLDHEERYPDRFSGDAD